MINKPREMLLVVDAQGHEVALFRKRKRTERPLEGDLSIENVERLKIIWAVLFGSIIHGFDVIISIV